MPPPARSVAAPTTSLPEKIGGQRNWDYRFCWIRDSNFMIDALLQLGCHEEARSLFWWFMQATARTVPELHVLYRLDGGIGTAEREIDLAGYRGSRPVRVGNAAAGQTQLDIYGALFETAWLYSEGHQALDQDTGAVLARIADHVCRIWRQPDSGIWEVRNGPFHFTHSKVMCWVALDRAARLAERGELPAARAAAWRREAEAIRAFVETECWSDASSELHPHRRQRRRRRQPADAAASSVTAIPAAIAFGAPSTPSTGCFGTATSSIAITPTMACLAARAAS